MGPTELGGLHQGLRPNWVPWVKKLNSMQMTLGPKMHFWKCLRNFGADPQKVFTDVLLSNVPLNVKVPHTRCLSVPYRLAYMYIGCTLLLQLSQKSQPHPPGPALLTQDQTQNLRVAGGWKPQNILTNSVLGSWPTEQGYVMKPTGNAEERGGFKMPSLLLSEALNFSLVTGA